jgi:hypothetical protein
MKRHHSDRGLLHFSNGPLVACGLPQCCDVIAWLIPAMSTIVPDDADVTRKPASTTLFPSSNDTHDDDVTTHD